MNKQTTITLAFAAMLGLAGMSTAQAGERHERIYEHGYVDGYHKAEREHRRDDYRTERKRELRREYLAERKRELRREYLAERKRELRRDYLLAKRYADYRHLHEHGDHRYCKLDRGHHHYYDDHGYVVYREVIEPNNQFHLSVHDGDVHVAIRYDDIGLRF